MNLKLQPKNQKYVRGGIAAILTILGIVFMIFPFIPLGYLFILAGLILFVPYVPIFQRWLNYFKTKDKKNHIEKVEGKVDDTEDKFNKKFVQQENNN